MGQPIADIVRGGGEERWETGGKRVTERAGSEGRGGKGKRNEGRKGTEGDGKKTSGKESESKKEKYERPDVYRMKEKN